MSIIKRLKNCIIIHSMNFLSLFSGIKKEIVNSHLENNKKTWGRNASGRYIENQSALDDLFYGQECPRYRKMISKGMPLTAAFNSCEIIALQNALVALGVENSSHNLPEKISHFETRGIILKGYLGTAPKAVKKYLESRNIVVKQLIASKENFGTTPVQILFFQNGKKLSSGIHTICIVNNNNQISFLNGKPDENSVPLLLWSLAK